MHYANFTVTSAVGFSAIVAASVGLVLPADADEARIKVPTPALEIPLTLSPLPLFPLPWGEGRRGGIGERGHFRHFHGFRVPVSGRA